MTLAIVVPGSNFSHSVGQLGLVHSPSMYHVFGASQAASIKSQLFGGADLVPVGSPTYGADSATLPSVNTSGYDSPALFASAVGGAYTMFAVLKKPASNAVVVGSVPNAQHWQGIYYYNGGWTVQANAPQASLVNIPDDSGTGFAFVAVRASAVSKLITVDQYGVSGRVTDTDTMPSLTIAYNTAIRIGRTGNGSSPIVIAAAGCIPNYLSDSQVNDVYLQVKADLASRGVTIL